MYVIQNYIHSKYLIYLFLVLHYKYIFFAKSIFLKNL